MQTSIPPWRQLNWGHHCRNPQLGSHVSMPPLPLGAGFAGGEVRIGQLLVSGQGLLDRLSAVRLLRRVQLVWFGLVGSHSRDIWDWLWFSGGGAGGGLRGGFNFCFQEFLARVYKIFIFALGLGTGLSFYGVWRLS